MSFKDGAALGGRRGLDFQLSALGFESIGSDNVHPEQKIDLLLNKTTSCHEKKEVNTGEEAVNKTPKRALVKFMQLYGIPDFISMRFGFFAWFL